MVSERLLLVLASRSPFGNTKTERVQSGDTILKLELDATPRLSVLPNVATGEAQGRGMARDVFKLLPEVVRYVATSAYENCLTSGR